MSLGSPWFTSWMNPVNGALPSVTRDSPTEGGHATCLYRYNKTQELFYGVNSWGEEWGNRGLFTMPFSAIETFKQLGGYDAHYITFTVEPVSKPPITQSTCIFGNTIAAIMNVMFMQKLRNRKGRFAYVNFGKG